MVNGLASTFHKTLDTGQPPRYRYCFALKGVTRGGNRVTHARSDVKRWLKRCWWETANAPETGCARGQDSDPYPYAYAVKTKIVVMCGPVLFKVRKRFLFSLESSHRPAQVT